MPSWTVVLKFVAGKEVRWLCPGKHTQSKVWPRRASGRWSCSSPTWLKRTTVAISARHEMPTDTLKWRSILIMVSSISIAGSSIKIMLSCDIQFKTPAGRSKCWPSIKFQDTRYRVKRFNEWVRFQFPVFAYPAVSAQSLKSKATPKCITEERLCQ